VVAGSVHPQAQQLLDGKAASGVPPLWELTPDEGRAGVAANAALIVAGDSAGGNLAAVTALRARDAGGPPIALQVLVYPVTDCDLDRRSYHQYEGTELILNRGDMVWFWDHYVPEHDPLRDEGFAYAERLRAERVPTEHRHFGSQIHGFFTFVNLLDDADRAVTEAGAAIRAAVESADKE
jgi:acetyl esterase